VSPACATPPPDNPGTSRVVPSFNGREYHKLGVVTA
jgi:hypothetical protein